MRRRSIWASAKCVHTCEEMRTPLNRQLNEGPLAETAHLFHSLGADADRDGREAIATGRVAAVALHQVGAG
jgi:hypothetical protein